MRWLILCCSLMVGAAVAETGGNYESLFPLPSEGWDVSIPELKVSTVKRQSPGKSLSAMEQDETLGHIKRYRVTRQYMRRETGQILNVVIDSASYDYASILDNLQDSGQTMEKGAYTFTPFVLGEDHRVMTIGGDGNLMIVSELSGYAIFAIGGSLGDRPDETSNEMLSLLQSIDYDAIEMALKNMQE